MADFDYDKIKDMEYDLEKTNDLWDKIENNGIHLIGYLKCCNLIYHIK